MVSKYRKKYPSQIGYVGGAGAGPDARVGDTWGDTWGDANTYVLSHVSVHVPTYFPSVFLPQVICSW